MSIVTLRAVRQALRTANDVVLDVPDAEVEALLDESSRTFSGRVTEGSLAWPAVRYLELEVEGFAFEVVDVVRTAHGVTVTVGERTDSGSAF